MTTAMVQVRGSGADSSPKRIGHDMPVRQGCRKTTGDFGKIGAQLDCYVSASSLYVLSSDPREEGDNNSGLRSGAGAEWK